MFLRTFGSRRPPTRLFSGRGRRWAVAFFFYK
jgi:hypothetical protein